MNKYKKPISELKPLPIEKMFIDSVGIVAIKAPDEKGTLVIYPTFKVAGKYPAFNFGGQTLYIHRCVYSAFVDEEYKGQLTMKDGDWDNMTINNIVPGAAYGRGKKGIDPWSIRKMYCAGMTFEEMGEVTGLKRQHLFNICRGFSGVKIEEVESGLMLFM